MLRRGFVFTLLTLNTLAPCGRYYVRRKVTRLRFYSLAPCGRGQNFLENVSELRNSGEGISPLGMLTFFTTNKIVIFT